MTENEVFANRYLLIEKIGVGGFSEVWKAADQMADNAEVAIKIYAPEKGMDAHGLKQFRKEYSMVLNINHTNLLTARYFDVWEDRPYLVMPLITGGSLYGKLIQKGTFSEDEIAELLSQISGGMQYLHQNEILHQDIKPDNILIGPGGSYLLTDFGISGRLRSTLRKSTSSAKAMTVAYAPPERFAANPQTLPSSDIFSLGVLVYELATGDVPWMGSGGMSLQTGAKIPVLPDHFTKRFEKLVHSMLSLDPAARPAASDINAVTGTYLTEGMWPEIQPDEMNKKPGPANGRKTQRMDLVESSPSGGKKEKATAKGRRKSASPFQRKKVLWITAALLFTLFSTAGGAWLMDYQKVNRANALYEDGLKYYNSLMFDEAFESFSQASEMENPSSHYFAGRMYHEGESVDTDYELARQYYEKALAAGDSAGGNYGLAGLYRMGNGVDKDEETADKYYLQALPFIESLALNNNWFFQHILGLIYRNGYGIAQNNQEAFRWIRQSAEQNYPRSQNYLGYMYENGFGVDQDYEQTVYWYRLAADQGYATAQRNLGLMYRNGQGVEQDDRQAVHWYRLAAEQGYALSQNNMGFMYENGYGVEQDYEQAANWYRLAADQGYATAQRNLGLMYRNGQGVDQDDQQAVYWYRLAAEQGHASSQNNMGYMYEYGYGVEQDYEQAVSWYRLAADQNLAVAQNNLGVMYRNGRGVDRDYEQAVYWYRKSAEQDYANGQLNLGYMYSQGYGVAEDQEQAVYWYRKSAVQGNETAQGNLLNRGLSW